MPDSPKRPPRLILASSSPYRRELLERLRVPFDVVVPAIDETPLAGETPEVTALRLAEAKARAVAGSLAAAEAALVIGSDQVATYDGLQIGKPGTHEKALAQLQAMRGREVLFHSALCLFDSGSGNGANRRRDHPRAVSATCRTPRSKPICEPKRRTTSRAAPNPKGSASRCSRPSIPTTRPRSSACR